MSYSVTIFPSAARELGRWRAKASSIPNAVLRRLALDALRKPGNMLGAALFAVLAPRNERARAVRALVALQGGYNYLDVLAEQPSPDPVGNGRQLHRALLAALASSPEGEGDPYGLPAHAHAPGATGEAGDAYGDYYAHHPHRQDGGYLLEMVETTRTCLRALPSYALVAPAARAAASRIVHFQSFNLGVHQGGHDGLQSWAREQTPANSELRWWETAAAGGSSLAIHALIALAAQPELDPAEVTTIERAYFPWIGALHTLLDSMVDVAEDRRDGQRNLLSYYASPAVAAARMGWIAVRAQAHVRTLAHADAHEMILATMASYYLSAPQVSTPQARAIGHSVTDAAGPMIQPAFALFKAARAAASLPIAPRLRASGRGVRASARGAA